MGNVGNDSNVVTESAWTTIAYSCDVRFREHTGEGYHRDLHVRMAACSKRPKKNEEESATLPALMVEGDCVLDFCLERESYDSG